MSRRRPSLRAALTNLRQPMPFGTKVWLLMANNFKKLRTRQDCCGHFGEPGC